MKISDYTPTKEQYFRKFMAMHAKILKNIQIKYPYATKLKYHYIDLTAGCGVFTEKISGTRCSGSPIIAIELLYYNKVNFRAILCENNKESLESLKDEILRIQRNTSISVQYLENHQNLLPKCCNSCTEFKNISRCHSIHGLIYYDPYSPSIESLDLLIKVSELKCFSKLDFLLHIPATTIKRVNGLRKSLNKELNPSLIEILKQINKKFWLIKGPTTAWQWVFLYGTNFHSSSWDKEGWFNLFSENGQNILKTANRTSEENANKAKISEHDQRTNSF